LIDGIDGETMLMSLDLKGYAVSTGAACSSGNPEPSHVLLAMGLDRSKAQTSLRISFGIGNTVTEVDQFLIELQQSVARLRKIMNESFVEKNSVKEDLNFNL
jgi:cysteine desulfurase